MKNNKLVRELVPVIALLLFIIVILILCVVSARGKRASEETETASETVAESTVPEQEETGEQAVRKMTELCPIRSLWRFRKP